MKNRLSVLFLVVLFVAIGAGNAFGASSFPEKPITVVVAYSAGGGSDIFARMLASSVEKDKLLPKPLVVENKPGSATVTSPAKGRILTSWSLSPRLFSPRR
jgi:tripartite-type tricarboxylate transporter receptor subunit TctC